MGHHRTVPKTESVEELNYCNIILQHKFQSLSTFCILHELSDTCTDHPQLSYKEKGNEQTKYMKPQAIGQLPQTN